MRLFLLSVLDYLRAVVGVVVQSLCIVVALAGLALISVAFYALALIPRRVMVILLPSRDA